MIGWGEIALANINPRTIVQHWTKDSSDVHARRGGKVILSPGPHAYLDMKYDSATVLGLRWAGLIDLRTAYDWDPATLVPGVGESSILGVEAPLWAETLDHAAGLRVHGVSAASRRSPSWGGRRRDAIGWDGFRRRIGAHGARLAALGVNFARVPGIDWTW